MPPDSPTKTSKEIHVEIHPVPGERPSKSSRRANDKDGKKVIIDSRQHDEDMASAQISALQKSMEQGFSRMAESLTTALTQTLERYVCEEVIEGDLNDNNLPNPSQDKPSQKAGKSSSPSEQMDVDASVNDLLSDAKEHGNGKQHEVDESVGDFLKTVQNDLKSEETGPPIHEELAKIVTRLVRDGMLEERLQENINKYPQSENCEGLTKVRVNQLIWDNLSSTIRSQDLKFQKVQTSVVKGMTTLARVTDAILKRVNEINGGKVLAQEAIDSLSHLAHANTELNNRRKELIKPDLHTDYKHLCSASTTVTAELFGDDLSKQVKDISEVNRVGRKVTTSTVTRHKGPTHSNFGYKSQSCGGRGKFFRARGSQKHFLGWRQTASRGSATQSSDKFPKSKGQGK